MKIPDEMRKRMWKHGAHIMVSTTGHHEIRVEASYWTLSKNPRRPNTRGFSERVVKFKDRKKKVYPVTESVEYHALDKAICDAIEWLDEQLEIEAAK